MGQKTESEIKDRYKKERKGNDKEREKEVIVIFWVVTQYGRVGDYKRFSRTCCSIFMVDFYIQVGESRSLRNVVNNPHYYTLSQLEI
jgi:hypothetical protein